MSIWLILFIVSGLVPLARAIWANRHTTLLHALVWGLAAWGVWLWLAVAATATAGYVATSLTACAGVAVLGARRPGVGAWNAVVAGLLVTLLLPLAQDYLTGNSWLHGEPWSSFYTIIFLVAMTNLTASRAGLGSLGIMMACFIAMIASNDLYPGYFHVAVLFAGISLWSAWLPFLWRKKSSDEFDRLWLGFRDRFGWIWILRVQEQFRNAAKNQGLAIDLSSRGLKRLDGSAPDEVERAAALDILIALMKRFGLP